MAKYDSLDFVPPKGVAAAAARGLKLHAKSGKASAAAARKAEELQTGTALTVAAVKSMLTQLEKLEEFSNPAEGKPVDQDKNHLSFLCFGGKAGLAWARKMLEKMKKIDEKNAVKKKAALAVANEIIKAAGYDFVCETEEELLVVANSFDLEGDFDNASLLDETLDEMTQPSQDPLTSVESDVFSNQDDPSYRDMKESDAEYEFDLMDAVELSFAVRRGFDKLDLHTRSKEVGDDVVIMVGANNMMNVVIHPNKSIDVTKDSIPVFHLSEDQVKGGYTNTSSENWIADLLADII